MPRNTFQDMSREYFTHLDKLNKNDLNNYIVGLLHSQLINQANWFLSRPINQFHLEHAFNNHAEATGCATHLFYTRQECYCWYQLSLQVIELLLIGRDKIPEALNQPITLPHCSDIKTPVEIAEILGLFKFLN